MTQSNMTVVKLQLEAVNKLYELSGGADDYGHCMVDVEKAIPIISDQIQKAVEEKNKKWLELINNSKIDLQQTLSCSKREAKFYNQALDNLLSIYKLLSIQSKGK